MLRLLPLATFVMIAVLLQTASILAALAFDEVGGRWTGLAIFGVLYLGMFAVAWKITVAIVDRYLVPRGIVEGGDARGRRDDGRRRDLAHSMR